MKDGEKHSMTMSAALKELKRAVRDDALVHGVRISRVTALALIKYLGEQGNTHELVEFKFKGR